MIEAGPLAVGAILAKSGDTAIDDARVGLAQAVVIDAEPGLDVRAEILDRPRRAFPQGAETLRGLSGRSG